MKNGATAAYLACQCGHLDILKYLVEKNANVKSIKTFDGMSCLHAACQGGHLAIVKYLVSFYATTNLAVRGLGSRLPLLITVSLPPLRCTL